MNAAATVTEEGLILAKKGLADLGDEIEEMEEYIYQLRKESIPDISV